MREGILKAGVHQCGGWTWTYHDRKCLSVLYWVNTLDLAHSQVRLSYSWVWRSSGETESAEYTVGLTTTRPRFGGLRWWFLCPLLVGGHPCRRRVSKLHLPPEARYFGCRRCYDLTYTSCQESHKYDRVFRFLAQDTGFDFETVKWAMNRIGKRK